MTEESAPGPFEGAPLTTEEDVIERRRRYAEAVALRHVAYHEAGHAMVSYILGIRFRKISIKRKKNSLGRILHPPLGRVKDVEEVDHKWPDFSQKAHHRFLKEVMICMGGAVAENIVFRTPATDGWYENLQTGSEQDFADIAVILHRFNSEEENDPFLKWLWMRTFAMLKRPQYWWGVETLARALLQMGELNYVNACTVIAEGLQQYEAGLIMMRAKATEVES